MLGIGLNVLPLGDVRPGPGGLPATSLAEHGATTTDRTDVAVALLTEFDDLERRWRYARPATSPKAGLLGDYRAHCATLGQDVEVQLPDGTSLVGRAADIDAAGQLQVDMAGGQRHTVFAGDVVHVRPA